ncbi:hypothetical protein M0811_05523 [Anaeramoeba ignava]|uniref:Uncharacterized protein n=1 Tax=Anaeramoeba ignava TaxID=1746090 RepID=A0A9Q0RFL6_ANAIG|nr:hypothetical protein M0811_05523 [Anaeramoeba ignava]|eukprot:Anaeramoba_ignava/a705_66.p2 GENE.a705_66~~a705_66.p2  ORF type:complete len:535 (+),score=127.21 a705_66:2260-3864(+)
MTEFHQKLKDKYIRKQILKQKQEEKQQFEEIIAKVIEGNQHGIDKKFFETLDQYKLEQKIFELTEKLKELKTKKHDLFELMRAILSSEPSETNLENTEKKSTTQKDMKEKLPEIYGQITPTQGHQTGLLFHTTALVQLQQQAPVGYHTVLTETGKGGIIQQHPTTVEYKESGGIIEDPARGIYIQTNSGGIDSKVMGRPQAQDRYQHYSVKAYPKITKKPKYPSPNFTKAPSHPLQNSLRRYPSPRESSRYLSTSNSPPPTGQTIKYSTQSIGINPHPSKVYLSPHEQSQNIQNTSIENSNTNTPPNLTTNPPKNSINFESRKSRFVLDRLQSVSQRSPISGRAPPRYTTNDHGADMVSSPNAKPPTLVETGHLRANTNPNANSHKPPIIPPTSLATQMRPPQKPYSISHHILPPRSSNDPDSPYDPQQHGQGFPYQSNSPLDRSSYSSPKQTGDTPNFKTSSLHDHPQEFSQKDDFRKTFYSPNPQMHPSRNPHDPPNSLNNSSQMSSKFSSREKKRQQSIYLDHPDIKRANK